MVVYMYQMSLISMRVKTEGLEFIDAFAYRLADKHKTRVTRSDVIRAALNIGMSDQGALEKRLLQNKAKENEV